MAIRLINLWMRLPFIAFAMLTTTLPFSWKLLGSFLLSGGFTTAIRIVEFVAAAEANFLVWSNKMIREIECTCIMRREGCMPSSLYLDVIVMLIGRTEECWVVWL